MLKAEINQSELSGGQRLSAAEIKKLFRILSKIVRSKKEQTVSVAFVDQTTIRKCNRDYRGKNLVTDVLSFELGDSTLGEVLICYPIASQQAKDKKIKVKDEIALLIIHGVLHLLGHDHEKKQEAKIMQALQDWILDEYKKND